MTQVNDRPPAGAADEQAADALAGVRSVFQPVVELVTGRVVGFEALARGRSGTAFENPGALFGAAREADRLAELELACRSAALEGAVAAGWGEPLALFVNVEPESVSQATGPAGLDQWRSMRGHGPVVVEITERALVAHPAELFRGVDALRAAGCLIAVDDVGADDRSLALLAFLRPEIIKLDLRLIQPRPSRQIAEVVHAVTAEAERTGAQVVAEGIETDAHLETALAFGATLGQGYRFGRPGPWTTPARSTSLAPPPPLAPPDAAVSSPFELVAAAGMPPRRARKPLLSQIAAQLEQHAGSLGSHAVLLATFEDERYFPEDTRRRYEATARTAAFVAVFGGGFDRDPATGVRGQPLVDGEPMRTSWDVAVISPHFSAVLVSRDLGDPAEPDEERRFDFAVVHDRELAVAVGRMLMGRID